MKRFVRILTAVLLLCLLVGCVWEDGGGEGSFTFAVTHSDGTVKEFNISAEGKTLAEALSAEGLVTESTESAGLYDVVDGERADWNDGEAWWCYSQDGVPLMVGIQDVTPKDGDRFEAAFMRGYDATGEME